jgi:hypothetical protein
MTKPPATENTFDVSGIRQEQTSGRAIPAWQKTELVEVKVTPTSSPPAAANCQVVFVPQPDQRPSSRFAPWFAKLRKMAALQEGWDSYSAPKPSRDAVAAANLYLTTLDLLAWEPARVEPSAMGGVGITHRQDARKVYVEFSNNGTVHALFSDRADRTPKMETTPVTPTVPSFYHFIRKAREYLNG